MSWRFDAVYHVTPSPLRTDVYEWGVYSGDTIKHIMGGLRACNKRPRKVFGFDSFEGLPENTDPKGQPEWFKGQFDAKKLFNVSSVEEAVAATKKSLADTMKAIELTLVPGFYEDVLKDELVEQLDMKPAMYVDVDVDLYGSTLTLLDFMLRNKLIVPGTIIGYDDWGGTKEWEGGESQAHKEMMAKYDLKPRELFRMRGGTVHTQVVFKI